MQHIIKLRTREDKQRARRYIFERVEVRKDFLWTARPCYNSWKTLPRASHSNFELCSSSFAWGGGDWTSGDGTVSSKNDHKTDKQFQNGYYNNLWKEAKIKLGVEIIISQSAPENMYYKCKVKRVKTDTFPIYRIYLKEPRKKIFLLAAKKSMMSHSGSYTISTSPSNFSREAASFVGKLRSNLIRTKYTLYEYDLKKFPLEIGGVIYPKNLFGLKQKKFTVLLPSVENETRKEIRVGKGLHESFKNNQMNGIICVQNNLPTWDYAKREYVLNFGRRAKPSIKNFKLSRENPQDLVMQLCKTSTDSFSLIYSYPLCALQAFGIALSRIDQKLICE